MTSSHLAPQSESAYIIFQSFSQRLLPPDRLQLAHYSSSDIVISSIAITCLLYEHPENKGLLSLRRTGQQACDAHAKYWSEQLSLGSRFRLG